MVGVASTRNPEIVSIFERQVRVMEESFTLDIRTRRGGLMSVKKIFIERWPADKAIGLLGLREDVLLSGVATSPLTRWLVRESFTP